MVALLPLAILSCKTKEDTAHTGHSEEAVEYTCSMHPQIIRNAPGNCPICGMALVKKEMNTDKNTDISLTTLLRPTNEYVVSAVPATRAQYRSEPVEIESIGYATYNTTSAGTISARIAGRIERLYVKYRYQPVAQGQRIMDLYSPELVTAQENLLFLLKNDPANWSMIDAARQKLLLLGMSASQLNQVVATGKAMLTISIYSNYSGHIHEATEQIMQSQTDAMDQTKGLTTRELSLKEGMYVQKGQAVFYVFDPGRLWCLLSIYQSDLAFVKPGNAVTIIPEANPEKSFKSSINYIEPAFRQGNKTATARVAITNPNNSIPVGSQIRASIFTQPFDGWWLPKSTVLTLGMHKVVLLKQGNGFVVHQITVGHAHDEWIQIIAGLGERDSVAVNAQYLLGSESFIKIN